MEQEAGDGLEGREGHASEAAAVGVDEDPRGGACDGGGSEADEVEEGNVVLYVGRFVYVCDRV